MLTTKQNKQALTPVNKKGIRVLTDDEFLTLINTFKLVNGSIIRKLCRFNRFSAEGKWRKIKKTPDSNGYVQVQFLNRILPYHHIVMMIALNRKLRNEEQIDHIDGNPLNNQLNNLRICTPRQNTQNKIIHRNGKLVGMSYNNRTRLYEAYIVIKNTQCYLGSFLEEEVACNAYKLACENVDKYENNLQFRKMLGFYKLKGVVLDKRRNVWYAQIHINKSYVYLGNYNSRKKAEKARMKAEELRHLFNGDTAKFRKIIFEKINNKRRSL